MYTYFAEPWITERDRHSAVDREVEFKDSQFYHSMKPIKPLAYGERSIYDRTAPTMCVTVIMLCSIGFGFS